MKKNCELCKGLARMHCESDQASLCWTCDFKVHSANFLVARHSRTLLCHVCHSPTPWTATGTKLCPTVSVCDNCLRNCRDNVESEAEIDLDNRVEERRDIEDCDDDEEEDDDEVDEEDEEDEENQVVPWSPTTPPPPPPPSSSSNGEEEGYDSSSSFSSPSRRGRRENVNTPPKTAEEAASDGGGRGRVEFAESLSIDEEGRGKRRRLESGRVGFSGSKR